MALINTLTAIDNGIDSVDATILGMGRGAGNLKLELLLTYLNKRNQLAVDFNVLGDVITAFSGLIQKYKLGTNLPYMISGANSLPQKDVMKWVDNRLYSLNNIVRALDNKRVNKVDNAKYPVLEMNSYEAVIIIGGGTNAVSHLEGIKAFIKKYSSIALIHATARHASYYYDMEIPQYFCLLGSEGKRLSKQFAGMPFNGICILPPYPRMMGTDVPAFVQSATFELPYIEFTRDYFDSCTTIALQTAALCCTGAVFVSGYDGYTDTILSEKEASLSNENRRLFIAYKNFYNKELVSLTPSLYSGLDIRSMYQYL
jgi:4-hydroxy 2-oxovalerate aldolase